MIIIEENLKKAIVNTSTCLTCGDYLTVPVEYSHYADPSDPSPPYLCNNKGCLHTTYFLSEDLLMRVNKVYSVFCVSLYDRLYLMTSHRQKEIVFDKKEEYSTIKVPLHNLDFSDFSNLIEKYKTYAPFV